MHRVNRSHEGFRRAALQAVLLEINPGGSSMTPMSATVQPAAPNSDTTLVLAIELSNASWVLAAQVPGLPRVKARRSVEPTVEALTAAIETYRDRAREAGHTVE